MSFGFSVGDIILVSQIAYKLYSTVTEGRRAATKDLKELADALFGLHCALDHLGKTAKEISATATDRKDVSAIVMHDKLDAMIGSCGTTLAGLETVTEKYREAAEIVDDDDDSINFGPNASSIKITKLKYAQIKEKFRVNWLKIRWDVERNSLTEYREKLQSHTDAINIVLSTFLWKTTHRIQTDGQTNAQKMQELQNQALQSNQSLLQLVKEVQNMLLASKQSQTPRIPTSAPASPQPQEVSDHVLGMPMGCGGPIHSARPHFGVMRLMAAPTMDSPVLPSGPQPMRVRHLAHGEDTATEAFHTESSHVGITKPENSIKRLKLPDQIVKLNLKRQSAGRAEFNAYQQRIRARKPPSKPSFLVLEIPAITHLDEGLSYIFRSFPVTTRRQATVERDQRKHEVVRWTQGFDHFLDSWASSPAGSKGVKDERQSQTVELLVHLNELIDHSDDGMKRVVYHGTKQAGIDNVLEKFQTVSKSVRGMKEVEEFEDGREEWLDSQNGG